MEQYFRAPGPLGADTDHVPTGSLQVFSMIIAMRSPTACDMLPGTATRRRRKNPMKHDWNGTPKQWHRTESK